MIPEKQNEVKEFRKKHGGDKVGEVTVDMVSNSARVLNMRDLSSQMYGGMRGIRGLVTETSLLDPDEVSFLVLVVLYVWALCWFLF